MRAHKTGARDTSKKKKRSNFCRKNKTMKHWRLILLSSEEIPSRCQWMLSWWVVWCVSVWCPSDRSTGSFLVWMSAAALLYKPSVCSVIDVSRCCVRHGRCDFFSGCKNESNQSAVKTWPAVKHMKASFVSLQINREGLTFPGSSLHACSYIVADSCHKH